MVSPMVGRDPHTLWGRSASSYLIRLFYKELWEDLTWKKTYRAIIQLAPKDSIPQGITTLDDKFFADDARPAATAVNELRSRIQGTFR